ncbi:MAG: serine/threonine protein kinase [Deltaproteobacteria bacterium]|nr:serine/threonine protein kinase [Deltaproteobacteria bacterium]
MAEDDLTTHPLAERFYRLTPDQVLAAVEVGGRRATGRFLILNSFENRVYQLELDDGRMVVGKFYRPGRWSESAILAEHRFLRELQEEEIPVAAPLALEPGRTLGEVEGIYYALFPRLGGRAPEEPSDEQLRILGRYLARIHNVGARRPEPDRPRIAPETYASENLAWLLEHGALPPEVRDNYAATVEVLLRRIQPLFLDLPLHRVHGDCHLNNLLWAPDGPTFLDFDDFGSGPAVQDIWLLAPSSDAEGRRQRDVLVEAYASMRDFKPAWLRLVEPLRALRYIRYSTWIARRFDDPAFSRTFGHFGTLRYWQQEVQDLREQIARIDHETPMR